MTDVRPATPWGRLGLTHATVAATQSVTLGAAGDILSRALSAVEHTVAAQTRQATSSGMRARSPSFATSPPWRQLDGATEAALQHAAAHARPV